MRIRDWPQQINQTLAGPIKAEAAPLLRRRCRTFQASAGIMDSSMPNLLALTFFHSGPSKPSAPGPPAQNAHGPHPVSGAKQTLGVTNHSISPLPPSHQPQRRRGRLTRGYGGGGRGGGVGGRRGRGRGRRAAAAARGGERRERARGEAAGPGERAQPPQLRGAQGHRDRGGAAAARARERRRRGGWIARADC